MALDATVTYNGNTLATMSNQETVDITYEGNTIASLSTPGTVTVDCANKLMSSDLVIGTSTLECADTVMEDNVVVTTTNSAKALNMRLTISGTNYNFDASSASSSVSGRYNYRRNAVDDTWDLIVYATGTLIFYADPGSLDLCAVGGGGGGAGGYALATSSKVYANYGGYGGGGYYNQSMSTTLPVNSGIALTIGEGGGGGTGNGTGGGQAYYGKYGTASSIGSALSAGGGSPGGPGSQNGNGNNGAGGNSARYCFDDSDYPSVCGVNRTSYRGSGGNRGTATAYWNAQGGYQNGGNGGSGSAGLIIVRSHRETVITPEDILRNGTDNLSAFTQYDGGANNSFTKANNTLRVEYTGSSGNTLATGVAYIQNFNLARYTTLHATFTNNNGGWFKIGNSSKIYTTGSVSVNIAGISGTNIPIYVAYTSDGEWPYSGYYAQLSDIWIE